VSVHAWNSNGGDAGIEYEYTAESGRPAFGRVALDASKVTLQQSCRTSSTRQTFSR
jgi:hypothetical protein